MASVIPDILEKVIIFSHCHKQQANHPDASSGRHSTNQNSAMEQEFVAEFFYTIFNFVQAKACTLKILCQEIMVTILKAST